MKKIKFLVLLALVFFFCLTTIAIAKTHSVSIVDIDKSIFGSDVYISAYDPNDWSVYEPNWNDTQVTEEKPSEKDIAAFIPESYTGDVTVTIYHRAKLDDSTYKTMTGKHAYSMMNNNTKESIALTDLIMASADIAIVKPDSGTAVSADMTVYQMTNFDGSLGNKAPSFKLNTDVPLPASLYVVSFTNTPVPTAKYTINATAGEHGTITPASADVEEGASQDFKITADKGYVIDTLKVDGSEITAAAGEASFTYTLKDVTKAQSIAVTFKKSETPGKDNVSEAGVSGEGVTAAEPVFIEAADEAVASHDAYADGGKELTLVKEDGSAGDTVTFKKEALVCAVKLEVTHTDPEATMTLTLSPAEGKSFDAAKKYYAMIQNKKSAAYTLFECAPAAGGKLTVTVKPVGDYFSENTVVVYTGTAAGSATPDTPTTGGGSGGGCNAGMAVIALLAFAPLALRRRR